MSSIVVFGASGQAKVAVEAIERIGTLTNPVVGAKSAGTTGA